jgi:hypothetical protein
MLEPEPNEAIRSRPYSEQPYWHVERARIGDTHTVPVEVVVNGYAVAETTIVADGVVHTPRPPLRALSCAPARPQHLLTVAITQKKVEKNGGGGRCPIR